MGQEQEQERWRQAKEFFRAALELEASQRSAFLDKVCAGDAELRQEVEAALIGNEQADSFPDSINPAVIVTIIGESQDQYQTDILEKENYVSQVIGGHYEIVRKLDSGGFSDIYLARDRNFRDRRVVVKMLRSKAARDPDLQRKFKVEIDALATLNHPNIVGGLETGYLSDGTCYLVEEFIDGRTLRVALEETGKRGLQGLDLSQIAEIVRQLGWALSEAHHSGIVHRDIKPENVMLQNLQGSGAGGQHVKLIDFGVKFGVWPLMRTDSGWCPEVRMKSLDYGK